jgi:hypothetical protein
MPACGYAGRCPTRRPHVELVTCGRLQSRAVARVLLAAPRQITNAPRQSRRDHRLLEEKIEHPFGIAPTHDRPEITIGNGTPCDGSSVRPLAFEQGLEAPLAARIKTVALGVQLLRAHDAVVNVLPLVQARAGEDARDRMTSTDRGVHVASPAEPGSTSGRRYRSTVAWARAASRT